MKAFFLSLITLVAFSAPTFAQKKAVQKAVIKTPGVMAEVCKTSIENFLVHEYGVSSVKANYKNHTVTVVWYTDRTNIINIRYALANMGYDADDVTAEPDAYKKLNPACKPAPLNSDSIKLKL